MNDTKYELEILTPLFMGGADGTTAELRPPSFKGMMRFWWRSLQTKKKPNELLENEANIFGGIGNNAGKSSFSIYITCKCLRKARYSPLPHKKVRFNFEGFVPGQKFTCILRFRYEYISMVNALFKLTVLLGGFGKRSRRGFGSISYKVFKDSEAVIKEMLQLLPMIKSGLKLTHQNTGERHILSIEGVKENDLGYPRIYKIILGVNATDSYWNLLRKIGRASHKHRDNSLGYVNRESKMRSPVVVSLVKTEKGFQPLITMLTSHFESNLEKLKKYDLKKQDQFINEVLA